MFESAFPTFKSQTKIDIAKFTSFLLAHGNDSNGVTQFSFWFLYLGAPPPDWPYYEAMKETSGHWPCVNNVSKELAEIECSGPSSLIADGKMLIHYKIIILFLTNWVLLSVQYEFGLLQINT